MVLNIQLLSNFTDNKLAVHVNLYMYMYTQTALNCKEIFNILYRFLYFIN